MVLIKAELNDESLTEQFLLDFEGTIVSKGCEAGREHHAMSAVRPKHPCSAHRTLGLRVIII
jgi:hypothetical protein